MTSPVSRRVPAAAVPGGCRQPPLSDAQHLQLPVAVSSQSILRCVMFNARSVVNKLGELHELLYDGATADCFCITESWLHDEISNGLLDPKSMFSIFRCDRRVERR